MDPIRQVVAQHAGEQCEAGLPGCRPTDRLGFHHRYMKGRVDTVENLMLVCGNCHTDSPAAIHRNPAASYESGLLIHSWDGMPTEAWREWSPGPDGWDRQYPASP